MKNRKFIARATFVILVLSVLWEVLGSFVQSLKFEFGIEIQAAMIVLLLFLLAEIVMDTHKLLGRNIQFEIVRGQGLRKVEDMIDRVKKDSCEEAFGTYFSDDRPPNMEFERKIAQGFKKNKISKYVLLYTRNEDKDKWAKQVETEIISANGLTNFVLEPIGQGFPGLNLFIIQNQVYIGFGVYDINKGKKEEIKGGIWIKDRPLANKFKQYVANILSKRLKEEQK